MPKEFLKSITQLSGDQSGLTRDTLEREHPIEFKYYKWSCYLIALAGIVRHLEGSRIAALNLILQSFLAYMSDVHTIGRPSYWHLLDRYFAMYVSAHHFYSITNLSTFMINVLLFGRGLQWLNQSQLLYAQHDKEFLVEHTKWHVIIFLMSVSMILN